MKNQPLILSILLGIVVLLIIGGISLSARLSMTSKQYKEKLNEQIELQKTNEILQKEKEDLLEDTINLKGMLKEKESQVKLLREEKVSLKTELEKVNVLKQKLEENLQEALMQKKRK